MSDQPLLTLPNERLDRISEDLLGMDFPHFAVATIDYLNINNRQLSRLLRGQPKLSLEKEIKSLTSVRNSPYVIVDEGIALPLSSHKWNDFVYGPFEVNTIEKSLKYFPTTLFSLYTRLWSFTPFYYDASYPILDLFHYPHFLESRPLSDDERTLFTAWETNTTPPKIVKDLNQFLRNFISRYEYDIWGSDIDWNLFVVAGGSVLSSLMVQMPKNQGSDVDLFFLEENPWLFDKAVNELEARLQNKYFIQRRTIWPTRLVQFDLFREYTVQDVFDGKRLTPAVTIQLIRGETTRTTISKIVHSFDLDICAAAFDSKKVLISFACLQSLNTGYTTCYALSKSSTDFARRATRLVKYQRRGFNILYPNEFDFRSFLSANIQNCQETRVQRTYRFRKGHFGDNCDCFELQKKFCEHFEL